MSYRAVDTNILSPVDVDLDTFEVMIDKINQIVDHLQNTVVTVANTDAYDGNNTGNGFVFGIFGGNTIVATTSLRGGNVSTSNVLTITSALNVSNTATITNTFTVVTGLSNVNSINVRGTANVAANLNVTGNTNLQSPLNIKTDYTVDVTANANMGAALTVQTFYAFPKASWSSAKVFVQSKRGSNTQAYETVVAHDGTTPHMAVYGVISAPPSTNNGLVSVSSNASHILLGYQQSAANTALKAVIHLVK